MLIVQEGDLITVRVPAFIQPEDISIDGSIEGTFDRDGHGPGWMCYRAGNDWVQLDCTLDVNELRALADYIEDCNANRSLAHPAAETGS